MSYTLKSALLFTGEPKREYCQTFNHFYLNELHKNRSQNLNFKYFLRNLTLHIVVFRINFIPIILLPYHTIPIILLYEDKIYNKMKTST